MTSENIGSDGDGGGGGGGGNNGNWIKHKLNTQTNKFRKPASQANGNGMGGEKTG